MQHRPISSMSETSSSTIGRNHRQQYNHRRRRNSAATLLMTNNSKIDGQNITTTTTNATCLKDFPGSPYGVGIGGDNLKPLSSTLRNSHSRTHRNYPVSSLSDRMEYVRHQQGDVVGALSKHAGQRYLSKSQYELCSLARREREALQSSISFLAPDNNDNGIFHRASPRPNHSKSVSPICPRSRQGSTGGRAGTGGDSTPSSVAPAILYPKRSLPCPSFRSHHKTTTTKLSPLPQNKFLNNQPKNININNNNNNNNNSTNINSGPAAEDDKTLSIIERVRDGSSNIDNNSNISNIMSHHCYRSNKAARDVDKDEDDDHFHLMMLTGDIDDADDDVDDDNKVQFRSSSTAVYSPIPPSPRAHGNVNESMTRKLSSTTGENDSSKSVGDVPSFILTRDWLEEEELDKEVRAVSQTDIAKLDFVKDKWIRKRGGSVGRSMVGDLSDILREDATSQKFWNVRLLEKDSAAVLTAGKSASQDVLRRATPVFIQTMQEKNRDSSRSQQYISS